ncbi:MAG: DUF4440 domain-containing protein [Cyanobium sp. LacPavin_0818_WC50_MAG_67_9]|nr:DUF4440 domain-containing protein [Cyanobium sp. LacPavin_0818_WC50_MAG_67_9]
MNDALPQSEPNRDQQLLALNQALLESVVHGDWDAYAGHCSTDLTCFEAETNGVLSEGLPFHRFYFDLPADPNAVSTPVQVTMARPHIRWIGSDAAVLSYTRLTQKVVDGAPVTASCCETRIWHYRDGAWKQVHAHRS